MTFNELYYNQTSYNFTDCYLNTHLGSIHATVELHCPSVIETMVVGLSMNSHFVSLVQGLIGSVGTTYLATTTAPFLTNFIPFFSPLDGTIENEDMFEVEVGAHLTTKLKVTFEEAKKVRDFILASRLDYENGRVFYSLFGNNCIDFANAVYQQAGGEGHFVDNMGTSFGVGWAYAKTVSFIQSKRLNLF